MIELIVGGARSGKSGYALNQAQANVQTQISNRQLSFIATAEAHDGEMQSRIERHQQERDSSWSLIEEPQNLSNLINQFSDDDVVLVDCLTLWLTNWLCSKTPELWEDEKKAFLEGLEQSSAQWLLVSNEVGLGVTPMGDLSRQFVDECGWLHQDLAQIADRVTWVMFGLPQTLKSPKS
jgi:adenosylcobinamide kinase/adenosylcobinamide-phosphate guanylyltransferase|tara:strand:+ start:426 stop:962 length:537 start_codon:yes stop_codon:yes gene_type:complete